MDFYYLSISTLEVKMLESRPEDALVNLVITVESVECGDCGDCGDCVDCKD